MADPATISNGHVVLNGVKREHEHEVVMTLAGLFKARNIMPVYICAGWSKLLTYGYYMQGDNSGSQFNRHTFWPEFWHKKLARDLLFLFSEIKNLRPIFGPKIEPKFISIEFTPRSLKAL